MEFFKTLYGLAFTIALVLFIMDPKAAMQDTYNTMVARAPRILEKPSPHRKKAPNPLTEDGRVQLHREAAETLRKIAQIDRR